MMTEKDAGRKDAGGSNKVERQLYGAQTKILLVFLLFFYVRQVYFGTCCFYQKTLQAPQKGWRSGVEMPRLSFVCG